MRNRWEGTGRWWLRGPSWQLRLPPMFVVLLLVAGLVPAACVQLGSRTGPVIAPIPSESLAGQSVRATAPLAITSFASFLPTMHEGESTYLNVTATGGAPPYTYWYYGLPLGCASQNMSSIHCYPVESARFTITAVVNDTVGASVNASIQLNVTNGYGGPPFIHYFYANPARATVLTVVLIYANATSNSSTPTQSLKFGYLDLPPGCTGFNQTILQCVPTSAGAYHIYLLVTDGFGAFATARAWLTVTGGNASTASTPVLTRTMQEYIGVSALGFIVVIAAIFLLPRGRKPRPGAPVQPWKP
ncbi:MAG: hypothetical protein L3J91_01305 [Thermoplasmata archaeon]|nr:hypothetical protein [Thermoplasmata archaeon]